MTAQVLIVGAGPVGLSLAIELGSRGVSCLVVEQNDRVGLAPRAKTTNVRTRTHLRRWGIADKLAEASPFGVDYPSDVHFLTRLGGFRLATIRNAFNCAPAPDPRYPEHGQWIPQYKLEGILRAHAETLPEVELRFNTTFLAADQDAETVRASLCDLEGGSDCEETARFLVGADGARSGVREAIGARMDGHYGLSRNFNIVFRAPGLAERHAHGPGTMYWQVNPEAASLMGPMDKDDIWFFMPTKLPADVELSDAQAAALIRATTGIDLDYEILSSDEWVASSLVADRYRDRRIFLAGDACHLHPPFGGYGMNMGISDSVDLGWKLAAVLRGWGGAALLDSYEAERRPIHRQVIEEAVANHAALGDAFWQPGLEDDTPEGVALREAAGARIEALKAREFHTLPTVLGLCYADSPIVAGEEGVPPAQGKAFEPSTAPGCLAPHAWLEDGSSLYDHFGQGFTLIVGPDADLGEAERARAEAGEMPFRLVTLEATPATDIYNGLLVLVRPDQHVAWRGTQWPGPGLLARVTGA